MISFRYHLVSIVAVFLALALGVVVGTTVVNQGIIDDLRNRTDSAAKNAENLRKQLAEIQAHQADTAAFDASVLPVLVRNQLTDVRVLLVTQEDVDAAVAEGVRKVIEDAGASVVAEVVVTDRMTLSDDRSRADLATAMGTPDSGIPEQLAAEAANAVAARLANGPTIGAVDLLDSLRAAGFIVIRGGSLGVSGIGGAGQTIVLLAGTDRNPGLDPGLFLAPLATGLVDAGRPVAAVESNDSVAPFVVLLRDGDLDGRMVTVDNADQVPGKVALVWALRDLLATPGNGGDYGTDAGASGLLPRLPP